jgi:hypothetical protein
MAYRVFVSSTQKDLPDHRKAVQDAIRQLGAVDVSMENFGARDERPLTECLRLIRQESDIFVGIYAHRYGYIPAGGQASITEMEYLAASDAELPRFIYLVDDSHPWVPAHIDSDSAAQRLRLFKDTLLTQHICQSFKGHDHLATNVVADLGRHIAKQQPPSVGPGIPVQDIGMESLLHSIPHEGLTAQFPASAAVWSQERSAIYQQNRNIFLTHFVRPSAKAGQTFDVYIYLIRHEAHGYTANDFADVLFAEFFLGGYWENKIFPAVEQNGFIGICTAAYGTMLCTCRVTFKDGKQIHLDRYIDFEAQRTD